MTDTEIRNKILEVFNLERQMPDLEFEETYFLDYLVHPPTRPNSLKNTFRGARKYYRFMDRIELEFGICFRLTDQDGYYSIDKFAEKVKVQLKKDKGNMTILKKRTAENDQIYFESSLITGLLAFFIWLGVTWFTITLSVIVGVVIFWTMTARYHHKRHNKRLYQKLLKNQIKVI